VKATDEHRINTDEHGRAETKKKEERELLHLSVRLRRRCDHIDWVSTADVRFPYWSVFFRGADSTSLVGVFPWR
jgi:hypothetical protein